MNLNFMSTQFQYLKRRLAARLFPDSEQVILLPSGDQAKEPLTHTTTAQNRLSLDRAQQAFGRDQPCRAQAHLANFVRKEFASTVEGKPITRDGCEKVLAQVSRAVKHGGAVDDAVAAGFVSCNLNQGMARLLAESDPEEAKRDLRLAVAGAKELQKDPKRAGILTVYANTLWEMNTKCMRALPQERAAGKRIQEKESPLKRYDSP